MRLSFMLEPSAAYEILDVAYDVTHGRCQEVDADLILQAISARRSLDSDDPMTSATFWRSVATLTRHRYVEHKTRGRIQLQDHEIELRRSQIANMLNCWFRGDLRRFLACLLVVVGDDGFHQALREIDGFSKMIKGRSHTQAELITEGLHRMAPLAPKF